MIYTIDDAVESPIMLIDKHIGFNEDDGMGIDGSLFQRELMGLDGLGKKAIQCWINSPGGNVYNGFMILNAILKSKTPVDTYNIGLVASMGFPIFMAGRKRVMMDYAVAMIHMPFNRDDPESRDPYTDALCESMVKMVTSKSKLSEDKVRAMLEAETWLTAQQCLDYGFATEIESTSELNKKWMPSNDTSVEAVWKKAKQIVANHIPSISNDKNLFNMKMVTAKLGLNEAATEVNVVDAIRSIESKAEKAEIKLIEQENAHKATLKDIQDKAVASVNTANAALAAKETELATVKASLAAKEQEFTAIKAKHDAMETEKNNAIVAEKKTKAETMIAAHVKTGRIKNDAEVIAAWVEDAIADFDKTVKKVEAIPLNVKAPVIIETKPVEGINQTSASMLAAKNKLRREGKSVPA